MGGEKFETLSDSKTLFPKLLGSAKIMADFTKLPMASCVVVLVMDSAVLSCLQNSHSIGFAISSVAFHLHRYHEVQESQPQSSWATEPGHSEAHLVLTLFISLLNLC